MRWFGECGLFVPGPQGFASQDCAGESVGEGEKRGRGIWNSETLELLYVCTPFTTRINTTSLVRGIQNMLAVAPGPATTDAECRSSRQFLCPPRVAPDDWRWWWNARPWKTKDRASKNLGSVLVCRSSELIHTVRVAGGVPLRALTKGCANARAPVLDSF